MPMAMACELSWLKRPRTVKTSAWTLQVKTTLWYQFEHNSFYNVKTKAELSNGCVSVQSNCRFSTPCSISGTVGSTPPPSSSASDFENWSNNSWKSSSALCIHQFGPMSSIFERMAVSFPRSQSINSSSQPMETFSYGPGTRLDACAMASLPSGEDSIEDKIATADARVAKYLELYICDLKCPTEKRTWKR